jgi:hypothetical protein
MKVRENINYLTMACAFMFIKLGYIIFRMDLISSRSETSSSRVPNSVGFCPPTSHLEMKYNQFPKLYGLKTLDDGYSPTE